MLYYCFKLCYFHAFVNILFTHSLSLSLSLCEKNESKTLHKRMLYDNIKEGKKEIPVCVCASKLRQLRKSGET